MSDNIPWQPPPGGIDPQPAPWIISQELYDTFMAMPPGTDITAYFETDPEWNLTITTGDRWATTNSPRTNSQEENRS